MPQSALNTTKKSMRRARWRFRTDIPKILAVCNAQNCDTILFSLWSTKAVTHKVLFPPSTNHKTVILSVRDHQRNETAQVWVRESVVPVEVRQIFGRSSAARTRQGKFVEALGKRIWGTTALILCGESNILRVPRGSQTPIDPHQALPVLDQAGVRIVLNPIHTYMRRFEMRIKRLGLARGHFLVSLWNRGFVRGSEPKLPWQVFRHGENVTDQVKDVSEEFGPKLNVRIGIINVR